VWDELVGREIDSSCYIGQQLGRGGIVDESTLPRGCTAWERMTYARDQGHEGCIHPRFLNDALTALRHCGRAGAGAEAGA
jgi:hypothetical protein